MCFWRKTFARVTIACWTRSCELPGPPGQGSVRMRFASASYCANASSRRLRAAEASGEGRSSWLRVGEEMGLVLVPRVGRGVVRT